MVVWERAITVEDVFRTLSEVKHKRQERDVALVDLVDRLLGGGVVIAGDITLAVADVDLVYVQLRALISSVATAQEKELLPRMGSSL